jgi:anhydro-N-acetylmuramic acid kinase
MTKNTWYIIGLMSGTSLDGIDIAYIKFTKEEKWDFDIIKTTTFPYTSNWKSKLYNAFGENSETINKLNIEYGLYIGLLINEFIEKNKIKKIDYVSSHGHTIFHRPNEGYTLQIGDGQSIANTSKQTVICDFRTQDVVFGGQGAPLVPIGDKLLFSQYDYCLNIGGFANVSYDENRTRKAYDICPANIVLNHYTRQIGLEYDDNGVIAKKGNLNKKLLNVLDSHLIYLEKKSLGNEIVVSDFIPLIDSFHLSLKDILHTYIEHFAKKIAQEIKPNTTTLITGGGALNTYLIKRIKHYTKSDLIIPDKELIDFKEALIFAFLGLLRTNNEINCLASVTGASKDHSSGKIFIPHTFV